MSAPTDQEIDAWARSRGGHKSQLTKALYDLTALQGKRIDRAWRNKMRELVHTAETQMMKAEYYNDKIKNDPNSQRLVKDQATTATFVCSLNVPFYYKLPLPLSLLSLLLHPCKFCEACFHAQFALLLAGILIRSSK